MPAPFTVAPDAGDALSFSKRDKPSEGFWGYTSMQFNYSFNEYARHYVLSQITLAVGAHWKVCMNRGYIEAFRDERDDEYWFGRDGVPSAAPGTGRAIIDTGAGAVEQLEPENQ